MDYDTAKHIISQIESTHYKLTGWEHIVIDTIEAMISSGIMLTSVERRKLESILYNSKNHNKI